MTGFKAYKSLITLFIFKQFNTWEHMEKQLGILHQV